MNILVYDVAAESGGALSVLRRYYDEHTKDRENRYYYAVSRAELEDTANITVLKYPSVKKSWLHRVLFDVFALRRITETYKIDEVLSLQNTVVPGFRGRQTVYMHNILPFSEYRFSLLREPKLWVYQNIIGAVIRQSLKRADRVIVQADWIRRRIGEQIPHCVGRTDIRPVDISVPTGLAYESSGRRFFYPASAEPFKNHRVIVDALRCLKQRGVSGHEVVFTLSGRENRNAASLAALCEAEELPVRWAGWMSREEVFSAYEHAVLLFPSYIETVGLPLAEGRAVGMRILAADCEYAREALSGYADAVFFDWQSGQDLAGKMEMMMRQRQWK